MSIKPRLALAILLGAATLSALDSAISGAAEPSQQNPTPTLTDEPTKPPYVFSTPIFIPTYLSATDLPSRGTSTPRPPGTVAGERTYVVEAGDNPSLIAKKVYGDAGKYRLIVEANNLTDATRLRVGTILIIPPLTPVATATVPLAPAAAASPSTPSIAGADASPTRSPSLSPIITPTPQAYPAPGDIAGIVQTLLRALSVIFFIGFLAAAILAFLFYRDAKRRQKISLIKRRLKGE